MKNEPIEVKKRLEYLRGEIRAERISYGEIAELQSLAGYIAAGDVELLEWAGVPEQVNRNRAKDRQHAIKNSYKLGEFQKELEQLSIHDITLGEFLTSDNQLVVRHARGILSALKKIPLRKQCNRCTDEAILGDYCQKHADEIPL